jgi:hypothetical protein
MLPISNGVLPNFERLFIISSVEIGAFIASSTISPYAVTLFSPNVTVSSAFLSHRNLP